MSDLDRAYLQELPIAYLCRITREDYLGSLLDNMIDLPGRHELSFLANIGGPL
jgi:hypothetical protein